MSESVTTSAPAAPPAAAPAPVQSDTGPVISGPPREQGAPLSVSEAARLLQKQRAQPQAPAPAPRAAPAPPPAPAAAPKPTSTADAMARALGVPVDGQQPAPAESTPAPTLPAPIDVELDGRRYTHDQLRQLLSQGSDYTKKTQALAEQTRAFQEQQKQLQSQAQALAQVLPYIQPEIQRLQQALQEVPQPDAALIDSNPQEYLRQQQRWQAALQEQQRLGQLNALQSQAQAQAMQRQVDAANEELAQEFPGWRDPKERAAWQQEIVDWALSDKGGYNRNELMGLTDARHLRTMMKAMQFDRWVAGVKTSAPPTIVGTVVRGVPPPPAPTAQVQQAEAQFDKRPNVRSGAALLSARRASNGGSLAR